LRTNKIFSYISNFHITLKAAVLCKLQTKI